MKEINIGRILLENRRRRGITQEQLAEYLGVSKASISKWETEASYPDIFMLPRLAAYFDLSIDELMGYEPQMTSEDIQRLYRRLSAEFAEKPFEQVVEECMETVRKYYSCYPLLFQIAVLLMNHQMMAESRERSVEIIKNSRELLQRVRGGTDDPALAGIAVQMEAWCDLVLSEPEKVMELLEPAGTVPFSPEPLLASAYQMTGNREEAEKILQAGMYKGIIALLNMHVSYMEMCGDNKKTFAETCRRTEQIIETFALKKLHPGQIASAYAAMAQGWALLGDREKALEVLEEYARLVTGNIYPLRLHGDEYFNRLESWIGENAGIGEYPPRNEAVIRHSMTQAVEENGAFREYAEEPRFQRIIGMLKENEQDEREENRNAGS